MKGRVAIFLAISLALVHSMAVEKKDAVQDPLIGELDKEIEEIKAAAEKAKADVDIAATEAKEKLMSKQDLMLNAVQGSDWHEGSSSPVGITCETASHQKTCSERTHCDWIDTTPTCASETSETACSAYTDACSWSASDVCEQVEGYSTGYCDFDCTYITNETICTNHSAVNCSYNFDYASVTPSAEDTCAPGCKYTAGALTNNSDATCENEANTCTWEADQCVVATGRLMRRSGMNLVEAKKIQLAQAEKKAKRDKSEKEKAKPTEEEVAAANAKKMATKKQRDDEAAAKKAAKEAKKAAKVAAKIAAIKTKGTPGTEALGAKQ